VNTTQTDPDGAAMRILVIEDHVKMASLLRPGLREEGMAVAVVSRAKMRSRLAGRLSTT
jgi:DNA-binding response OmpR family regulator